MKKPTFLVEIRVNGAVVVYTSPLSKGLHTTDKTRAVHYNNENEANKAAKWVAADLLGHYGRKAVCKAIKA